MPLKVIVATDINGGIGKDNKLLWHIPEDLKAFKEVTEGCTVIMGRNTFESLPFENGLPNRHNIVLTRKIKNVQNISINESLVFKNNITEVIEEYKNSPLPVFVIGGEQIYKQFLPYCNEIYLTKVFTETDADAFFKYDKNEFEELAHSPIKEHDNLKYQFRYLLRKRSLVK